MNSFDEAVIKFVVRMQKGRGQFGVFESALEQPIAEFSDLETAEKYALQIAETKSSWIVEVYGSSGALVGTYNSEDDAMPKPVA
jgi:hypothetical protein